MTICYANEPCSWPLMEAAMKADVHHYWIGPSADLAVVGFLVLALVFLCRRWWALRPRR